MPITKIVIGTRGSQLALYQANLVKQQLLKQNINFDVELKIIKTKGDILLNLALSSGR